MKLPSQIALTIFFLCVIFKAYSQNGDCPGEAVCTNQTENMISGSVNELNAANRGCLGANEATSSYWYQLCVSTNGTIEFAINPNGAGNDYDFAVWGPGASCPPTTAPIRCSFAATPVGGGPNGDITGLGNGAIDNSEGAGGNGWVAPINATAGQCFVVNINNYAGGSSTFNIAFGGTANLDCAILPVELFSFSCSETSGGIALEWNCATETNNSHFILERTIDGTNYDFVARINGAGTSSLATHYAFTDITAPTGVNYYRLRQVDFNGAETVYGPIACEYHGTEPALMQVYNLAGQEVFADQTTDYITSMNQSGLTVGIYVVVLTRGTERRSIKHIITDLHASQD